MAQLFLYNSFEKMQELILRVRMLDAADDARFPKTVYVYELYDFYGKRRLDELEGETAKVNQYLQDNNAVIIGVYCSWDDDDRTFSEILKATKIKPFQPKTTTTLALSFIDDSEIPPGDNDFHNWIVGEKTYNVELETEKLNRYLVKHAIGLNGIHELIQKPKNKATKKMSL